MIERELPWLRDSVRFRSSVIERPLPWLRDTASAFVIPFDSNSTIKLEKSTATCLRLPDSVRVRYSVAELPSPWLRDGAFLLVAPL